MRENEMIKHNAVCACSDFSEENRVLAIKKVVYISFMMSGLVGIGLAGF